MEKIVKAIKEEAKKQAKIIDLKDYYNRLLAKKIIETSKSF